MTIDPRVRSLVQAINRLPDVSTFSSCGGHENPGPGQVGPGEFDVSIAIEPTVIGWRSLALLTWAAQEASDAGPEAIVLKAWSSTDEVGNADDALSALSFDLSGRDGADPDAVARNLDALSRPRRPR